MHQCVQIYSLMVLIHWLIATHWDLYKIHWNHVQCIEVWITLTLRMDMNIFSKVASYVMLRNVLVVIDRPAYCPHGNIGGLSFRNHSLISCANNTCLNYQYNSSLLLVSPLWMARTQSWHFVDGEGSKWQNLLMERHIVAHFLDSEDTKLHTLSTQMVKFLFYW